jgi:hypothetical protein
MKAAAVGPGDAEALTARPHGDPISPDTVRWRTSPATRLLGSSHSRRGTA